MLVLSKKKHIRGNIGTLKSQITKHTFSKIMLFSTYVTRLCKKQEANHVCSTYVGSTTFNNIQQAAAHKPAEVHVRVRYVVFAC